MSLLTVIRRANVLVGLRRPVAAANAPDASSTAQMAELARIEAESLAGRHDWQGIVVSDYSFTTVNAQLQTGAIPADFDRFTFAGGIFSPHGRIVGPLQKADWSRLTNPPTVATTAVFGSFRVTRSGLEIYPTPPAGETYRFDYVTKKIYADANGTPKLEWSADTDTCRIPETLIALGVVWRWLQFKGLDYGEAMNNAELEFAKLSGKDNGGRAIVAVGISRTTDVPTAYPYNLVAPP